MTCVKQNFRQRKRLIETNKLLGRDFVMDEIPEKEADRMLCQTAYNLRNGDIQKLLNLIMKKYRSF